MLIFWIASGLIIAGTVTVLLWPLLRARAVGGVSRDAINLALHRDQLRDLDADLRAGTLAQEHYDRARGEIEKRLLEDVRSDATAGAGSRRAPAVAIALGVIIPICAIALYFAIGRPEALNLQAAGKASSEHGMGAQQFEALTERLAARLKEQPDNVEGWAMLGRSYATLGRFTEASAAFAEATARMPQDGQLLADYADALGMAQGRSLDGEPEKLIARALRADPTNVKALALAGTAAFNKKNYSGAIDYWERALAAAPPGSDIAQSIPGSIAEARSLGGSASSGSAKRDPGPKPAAGPSTGAGRVSGIVKLAPELAPKAGPGDTVFIFVRAAEGPPAPLAVLRKQVRDLPLAFTLDDSMAMNPETKLSAFPRVVVGARISKSANAAPRKGDLQGMSAPVKVGAGGLNIVIDTELP